MNWFHLTRSTSRDTQANPRKTRLSVESLEKRECLDGGNSSPLASPLPPPLGLSYTVQYDEQRCVTLVGSVRGGVAGTKLVSFTGVAETSVTTNTDGTFSVVAEASGLGVVHGVATDGSNTTGQVDVTLVSDTPMIENFGGVPDGNLWTFTGRVLDESPEYMVVRFGGLACLQGQTAVADANGYFTISVFRNAGDTGVATAVTTDWWSLTSDEAEDYVY